MPVGSGAAHIPRRGQEGGQRKWRRRRAGRAGKAVPRELACYRNNGRRDGLQRL